MFILPARTRISHQSASERKNKNPSSPFELLSSFFSHLIRWFQQKKNKFNYALAIFITCKKMNHFMHVFSEFYFFIRNEYNRRKQIYCFLPKRKKCVSRREGSAIINVDCILQDFKQLFFSKVCSRLIKYIYLSYGINKTSSGSSDE